jgi:carboxyl-terminal processing protease
MQSRVRISLVLALGVILGVAITMTGNVLAKRGDKSASSQIPIEYIRAFTDVYARIKNDYVEDVDDKKLIENAIRGMLTGLDPHSAYLSPDEFRDLRIGTTGEFGGLGIEVGMENGYVKVVAPIDDTPAQRAGVKPGDLIIRLDKTPVKGMTLSDAVKIMRGKPGTKIVLTILREGTPKPLKITLVRAVIKVKSVKSKLLEKGFGYVRITTFQSRTGKNLVEAISKLKKLNGGPLKGLVLDLRNNPGGVLGAAVSVSDAFLSSGLIVYTKGRVADSRLRFTATPGDVINGAPMVVLVNGGSASASEIVSGALQDHKRAIIMGTKTFGKGSVQTIMPSRGGGAVKLTTARYFTPKDRSIQAEGIVPDVEVKELKVTDGKKRQIRMLRERDLKRHLSNGNGAKKKPPAKAGKANGDKNLIKTDYQLFEALTLLKGLDIARKLR